MRYTLLAAFVMMLGATPALAKNWVVDYTHSRLGFIGTQGNASFEGSFKNFQTVIDFDPDKPETGKITATIDVASATAGSSERDSYLPQADWFDTKQFPQAQFASTSIRKTGDHAYAAEGTLTIKGIAQPVTLPFTLVSEANHWRAQGKITLIRTSFRIGEHDWSNEDYVKHAVDVVVDLVATPQS